MTRLPLNCPSCDADLREPASISEHDLLPVTYGGKVDTTTGFDDGLYVNDGNGFEWFDQDGTDRTLKCAECEHVLDRSSHVSVPRALVEGALSGEWTDSDRRELAEAVQ